MKYLTPIVSEKEVPSLASTTVQSTASRSEIHDRAERRRFVLMFGAAGVACGLAAGDMLTRQEPWYSTVAGVLLGWLALSSCFLALWILAARGPTAQQDD